MYTSLFSSIFNVILNYFLINEFGLQGAVYSTVITQILSLFVLNAAFNETKVLFFIQIKSLALLGIWSKN